MAELAFLGEDLFEVESGRRRTSVVVYVRWVRPGLHSVDLVRSLLMECMLPLSMASSRGFPCPKKPCCVESLLNEINL